MNRAMWLRILTVAVVAPYLYKVSAKEKGYFGVGLKLVAGGLIAMNVVPLIADAQTLKAQAQTIIANLAKAQDTLAKQNAARVVLEGKANAADAEFSET